MPISEHISKDTKVTIGTAIAIVSVAICSVWWGAMQLAAVRNELSAMATSLADLKVSGYTLAAASEQSLRMALANPGLRVPDPRDPTRLITADSVRYTPPN